MKKYRLEEKEINELIENKNKEINRYFTLCLKLQEIANKSENNIFTEYPYILAREEYEGTELTILRPGKYVYAFNTKEQALEFKEKIQAILNTLNKKNVEEKQKELYLKIKTINGGGQVKLKTTAAYNTTKTTAQKLLNTTNANINKIKTDILDFEKMKKNTENPKFLAFYDFKLEQNNRNLLQLQEILDALKKLDPNTILSKSQEGATLWRLTYWDNDQERRKQMAFGDIVIFYGCVNMGKNYTTVIPAATQKKRTDTRKADPNLICQVELDGGKNLYIRKIL